MPKTLFISDLDGTLLDKNAELSERSAEMLNKAYKNGCHFAVATARTSATIDGIMKNARPTVPSITQNGVSVYDVREKKYICTRIIEKATAKSVNEKIAEASASPFIYTNSDGLKTYYTGIKNTMMREFIDERIKKYNKKFTNIVSTDEIDEEITYFAVMDDEKTVFDAVEKIKNISGINYTYYKDIYETDGWYLEIFADTASKKHGVEFLREKYGFDVIVGFGDNLNDLPMFEACDVKIAVENAHEKVKAAADKIIGRNTDDSVARYILENTEK